MFLSWIDVKACSKVMSTTQTVKLKCQAADLHTDRFHFSFFLRRSYRVRQTAGGCRQLKTFFSLYLTDRACGFDEAPFCYFKVKIMGEKLFISEGLSDTSFSGIPITGPDRSNKFSLAPDHQTLLC